MAISFLLLFLVSVLIAVVGVLGLLGRLPPGSWLGIRLPYTLSSDERWYEVHRGAGPVLVFGGIAVASVNLAFLPFGIMGDIPATLGIIVTVASATILIFTVLQAALSGVRYAQGREGQ